nr:retrovirus-related Pol polyprotein from transposon TNT 1-94 [Tanacetum cinerariifolium]
MRPFHKQTALQNRYLVNTAKVKSINTVYTAKGKSVTSVVGKQESNAVKSSAVLKEMYDKKNSVLFTETEYLILSPDFKLPDENQVLLKNRVLVTKPHNKTPYELLIGRPPIISFMRPFGCPVTILNTLDHLGKFDGKVDEGFLVGYSLNSKAFRVYNSRTKKVEENLHVNFLENKLNVAGSGSKIHSDVGQEGKTKVFDQEYILLPVLNTSSDVHSSNKEVESSPKDDVGKKLIVEPPCVEGGKINDLGCL